jgi:flagellar motility protein MotE (MotC chaperone)
MKFPLDLSRVRLMPAICLAGGLLLCVKVAGVIVGLGPTPVTQAQAASKDAQASSNKEDPKSPVTAPVQLRPADPRPNQAAQSETELLQAVAQRRAELDRRAEEVQQREILLKATEQRIEEKVAKLQAMEKAIEQGVKKRDDEDDQRLKSLVKIYETMKPKEAARVFEQLELPVLLDVVGRMKEAKVAPILAAMDPVKAKSVTTALAEKLPAPKFE